MYLLSFDLALFRIVSFYLNAFTKTKYKYICSMTLFLYVAGPVNPTDASVDEQVQRCEGGSNHSRACQTDYCVETHYYHLWWFWLAWAIIFFLSCCCVCHHRRVKHRLQQQQRQHEINLIAYREAQCSTSPPFYLRFLPNYLLPDYEEVRNRPPTPPPPYSALNSASATCTTSDEQEVLCPLRQATPVPLASDPPCSRPSIEGFHSHGGHCHKDTAKPQKRSECCSGHTTEATEEVSGGRKENVCRNGQWQRHLTRDSGIELCMCTRDLESCEHKELRTLLSEQQLDDICAADNQSRILAAPLLQPHPHCIHLHTINELDGLHSIDRVF